ncbi:MULTISPECIES: folate-binding protein YgfZ [Prochlorococcus]|uniref:CAF17-like 4Fe-4S cluster assembly/insertion protein YgfZ n=1 Tax=Prochlorococcus TaxID=1218 RepID=UPI000533956A|nr:MULTISPECIES: folate-binding protein YgfZ [Prochlorococcus]KGG13087.1 Folate-dependent protein for Fe/S cluster synthesis/repair in oxidative stress [Prochlorococcus sp. MIT 0601]
MNLQDTFCWNNVFTLFCLRGEENKQFLHGQTTANILNVQSSNLLRTCWLSPTGRFKALLEVQFLEEDIRFIVLGGDPENVLQGFQKVIFPSDKVEVKNIGNIRRLQKISIHKPWSQSYVEWCDPGETIPATFVDFQDAASSYIEEWRINQGLPIGANELNAESNPYELGLSDFVDLNKGCYLGQETMAKLKNGSQIKQQLRFWQGGTKDFGGKELDNIRIQSPSNNNAGFITSYMKSSTGLNIGLAMIRRRFLASKELFIFNRDNSIKLSAPVGFVDYLSE